MASRFKPKTFAVRWRYIAGKLVWGSWLYSCKSMIKIQSLAFSVFYIGHKVHFVTKCLKHFSCESILNYLLLKLRLTCWRSWVLVLYVGTYFCSYMFIFFLLFYHNMTAFQFFESCTIDVILLVHGKKTFFQATELHLSKACFQIVLKGEAWIIVLSAVNEKLPVRRTAVHLCFKTC